MRQLNHNFQDLYPYVFIERLLYTIFQVSTKYIAFFIIIIFSIFYLTTTASHRRKAICCEVKWKYHCIKSQILCQRAPMNTFSRSRWQEERTRFFSCLESLLLAKTHNKLCFGSTVFLILNQNYDQSLRLLVWKTGNELSTCLFMTIYKLVLQKHASSINISMSFWRSIKVVLINL